MPTIHPPRSARLDPGLTARLGRTVPLLYGQGSPSDDVPGHVRAASAVRRWGRRIVVVQDDVNVLAYGDVGAPLRPVLLPAGPGGRRQFDDGIGNKRHKLDLEACATLPDGRLLAFGSGSSPARETLVVLDAPGPRLVPAPGWYAGLRACAAFAGSELNLEGALVVDGSLWLFQRGNGAPGGGRAPVNAIGVLDLGDVLRWLDDGGPIPTLTDVTPVDLGQVGGAALGFTDAARAADGRVAVLACAEASADAVTDGPVLGCRFGYLEDGGVRLTDVLDPDGRPTGLKLEGLEGRRDDPCTFDVVADMDRALEPARMGPLTVGER